jgi:hypothetical protein
VLPRLSARSSYIKFADEMGHAPADAHNLPGFTTSGRRSSTASERPRDSYIPSGQPPPPRPTRYRHRMATARSLFAGAHRYPALTPVLEDAMSPQRHLNLVDPPTIVTYGPNGQAALALIKLAWARCPSLTIIVRARQPLVPL